VVFGVDDEFSGVVAVCVADELGRWAAYYMGKRKGTGFEDS
jgi:hypothetical protein